MSIITVTEVIRYSPATRDFPVSEIRTRIKSCEDKLARELLGIVLYDDMVSKLKAVPSDVAEWVCNGDYAINDLVTKNGVYYKSTANTNNTDPEEDGSNWVQYEKFDHTCYEKMWTGWMRKIFAYEVYYMALPYASRSVGAQGLVIRETDPKGVRGSRPQEIASYLEIIRQDIDTESRNMIYWLNKNETGKNCLDALPENLLEDTPTRYTDSRRHRRVMFRV